MEAEKIADLVVSERLETLGVSQLGQWDVLMFLYRHGTSLTSAAQIGRLLGNDKSAVGAALDRLESLGLIRALPRIAGRQIVPHFNSHGSTTLFLLCRADQPG